MVRTILLISSLLLLLLSSGCQRKSTQITTIAPGTPGVRSDITIALHNCNEWKHYVPNAQQIQTLPFREVRVNLHFMRRSDGGGHFSKAKSREIGRYMIDLINDRNRENIKMNLPKGNRTPVLPLHFKFVLTPDPERPGDDGIYFHDDSELVYFVSHGKNANNYVQTHFEKYGVQKGKVLNIFIQPHHIDSVISKTYQPTSTGIAFPHKGWIKITGMHYFLSESMRKYRGGAGPKDQWFFNGIFNHELAHVLGLNHSWQGFDPCKDTPVHSNCWNYGSGPCKEAVSNNIMDYNAYQCAWTPCQLGIVHQKFATKSVLRGLAKPTWCNFNFEGQVRIRDEQKWTGARDVTGNIIIESDGVLEIYCTVSMAKGSKIIIRPGGKLLLNNATLENYCGFPWKGIEVQERGDKKGAVKMIGNVQLLNTTKS